MTDKAIEAAVRGLALAKARWTAGDNWTEEMVQMHLRHAATSYQAEATVKAYLAQREADGSVMAPVENVSRAHSLSVQLEKMVHYYGLGKAKPVARELVDCTSAMIAARPQVKP